MLAPFPSPITQTPSLLLSSATRYMSANTKQMEYIKIVTKHIAYVGEWSLV